MHPDGRVKVAVVGTGISGMSAAWLLSQRHDVTVYERVDRVGGHSNTILASVEGRSIPVDIGFIVFNCRAYPNLAALFDHLTVPTQPSDMSFAVSLDGGELEYSGNLRGLFAQRRNVVRLRFWSMLSDLVRFYRTAPQDVAQLDDDVSLEEFLSKHQYGEAFRDDHLLPMAGAIWSAAASEMLCYPASAFIRFHENHGLLQIGGRPRWETVTGGSHAYVERLMAPLAGRIRLNTPVHSIRRLGLGVVVADLQGRSDRFDHVVVASHADQALSLLADPTPAESDLLGSFRYTRNLAVLHTDDGFMPKRRTAWSSWNYIGARTLGGHSICVTYWMNRLQGIQSASPLFVTLNPPRPPRAGTILHSELYEHPVFDQKAMAAQRKLWLLQGRRNTWFCGAYFGAGFHEDGLQAGLAVAEQLGGVRRPWQVADESGRIVLTARPEASAIGEGRA
jgi:uncharacterized protein